MTPAITAEGLVKVYSSRKSEVRALDGVDLTSTRAPSSACSARTAPARPRRSGSSRRSSSPTPAARPSPGFDVRTQADEIRRVIGLSGQYAAVDENLTGRENLWLFGRLYHLPSREARKRADELLEQFELTDAADRVVKTYSGGMRRRLDLGSALIGRSAPADPRRADHRPRPAQPDRDVGRHPEPRASEGTTLLLTTQYLEEADELADTIAVVDHGKIIARGTADELKSGLGGERIEVDRASPRRPQRATGILAACGSGEVALDEHTRELTVQAEGGAKALVQVLRDLDEAGIAIDDIGLRRPTLDDVFIALTGHAAEPSADDAEKPKPATGDGRAA